MAFRLMLRIADRNKIWVLTLLLVVMACLFARERTKRKKLFHEHVDFVTTATDALQAAKAAAAQAAANQVAAQGIIAPVSPPVTSAVTAPPSSPAAATTETSKESTASETASDVSTKPTESGTDQATQAAATTPPAGPKPIETYTEYMARLRDDTRFMLNVPPEQWTPPEPKLEFVDHKLPALPNSVTPPPDKPTQDALVARHKLVRPVPYPFYRTLAIPSDSCGSAWQDYYYTHTLLARRYGLDLPSSYFPFSTNSVGHQFGITSVFSHESHSPRTAPLQIESQDIDVWPFFLVNYYRGWVDHIHSWTDDAIVGYSLLSPVSVTLEKTGEKDISLERRGGVLYPFKGLVLEVEQTGDVWQWQIELTDHEGLIHVVAWRNLLAGRSGWDLSDKSAEDLRYVVLPLDEEMNRSAYHSLGRRPDSGFPFVDAKLSVKGGNGAKVELHRLRAYQFDRGMVQQQLQTFQQFNVLPAATSYHGGASSWGCILSRGDWKATAPVGNGQSVIEMLVRRGEAGIPQSPTHHTDLLTSAGVEFYEVSADAKTQINGRPVPKAFLSTTKSIDGVPRWFSYKQFRTRPDAAIPQGTKQIVHFENLGHMIASFLQNAPEWGESESFYTHYNLINRDALKESPTPSVQMHQVKTLSAENAAGLKLLSNAHYNWTDDLRPYQRVWTAPVGVRLRHLRTLQGLDKHARLDGNRVQISPWVDECTGGTLPDSQFPTLDLHGQTFYVPEAQSARVYLGEDEITSLKRNPVDFTGRESVTIVDTSTPTRVFDELDLYDNNGRLASHHASYFFRSHGAYHGRQAMQIRAAETGASWVRWEPIQLECHETQYLRFAYRKDDPGIRFELSWKLLDGTEAVVTDGELHGRQGWQIPRVDDAEYYQVVLDFADMQRGKEGKRLPRGDIASITFTLQDAQAGASVWFDQIEFLAARGVRPHNGKGVVIGGRLHPPRDGEVVQLTVDGKTRKTTTTRGGWYWFTDVPVNAIAEVLHFQNGLPYYPLQGRIIETARNHVEYHIHTSDRLNPSVPRPNNYVGQDVSQALCQRFGEGDAPSQNCAALYAPHSELFYAGFAGGKSSYFVEDYANNYGWTDKDRDEPNSDDAIRICLQGECWTEGRQVYTAQRMNILLESILRQRLGVPVEVIKDATSSSSPASYADRFENYCVRFKPDLVLLFINPFNMTHMEPTLLRNLFGWEAAHSPYRMYDFDKQGKLVMFPADPGYGAFQGASNNAPLYGTVPMFQTFAVAGVDHPLAARTFDLLRGVLHDPYTKRLAEFNGKIGLIHGYCTNLPLGHQWHNGYAVVHERWRQRVTDFCTENDVLNLDLNAHLQNERVRAVAGYEHDSHPSPMGQYLIASALAEELLKLPELQKLAEQRRQVETYPEAPLPPVQQAEQKTPRKRR